MAEFEFGDGDLLLVIDVQIDFCPGGSLAVPGGDAVGADLARIVETHLESRFQARPHDKRAR